MMKGNMSLSANQLLFQSRLTSSESLIRVSEPQMAGLQLRDIYSESRFFKICILKKKNLADDLKI